MSTFGKFQRVSTKTLALMKGEGKKIAALTAYDFITAKLLDEAGIDLILVGDSLGNVFQGNETTLPVTMDEMIYHTKAVAKGVSRAMLITDLPFMSYQLRIDEAFRNAGRIVKETPAGGVKIEGGKRVAETIRKITENGIPVMGHLGLTPQSIHKFGSYKQRGTEEDEANEIVEDAKILEEAGAFAVVLEKIPKELAKRVTDSLTIPTIGIGAGPWCDGQILVTPDMLGLNKEFHPKFLRYYANMAEVLDGAFRQYIDDVRENTFPSIDESY
ncbi:MAG: 3-methyl-2-oxobutanoate hydroxymethyltransferase [Ignavibacteriales bacterium]|jgi:ketopantoate hydroxymethyltransferase (EC 2.1.2.11)|nr:MAG: 3-methyl-2-oxobutanoate hydroxymethyltransferase [Ignavibacteriaceae bacterium]MBW7872119.1 3-methyl-2-oxobutanoate hydroxymethyltransferase [Ignavibacteria bacterium]MCZ2143753.1 3-methyl-2-oxobutanoate hydroxymethyltransferase [Ignavibacteriales bacterium]MBV6445986.1 3-methyl-2-oxobutanoate hydroxymethyltransferase [Ignavibacteriaceae bacterium]MBZ0197754.1 3-methyl-2-oxobutanoate hydroxymethyltransferase [Ignavibacteriaceae bacterium]